MRFNMTFPVLRSDITAEANEMATPCTPGDAAAWICGNNGDTAGQSRWDGGNVDACY